MRIWLKTRTIIKLLTATICILTIIFVKNITSSKKRESINSAVEITFINEEEIIINENVLGNFSTLGDVLDVINNKNEHSIEFLFTKESTFGRAIKTVNGIEANMNNSRYFWEISSSTNKNCTQGYNEYKICDFGIDGLSINLSEEKFKVERKTW